MDTKSKAIQMKIQGLTYAEIGEKLGVSRQRAQQLVAPPPEIWQFVAKRADWECENCGVELSSGHVHHKDNTEDYNDVDNLQYLCSSCHTTAHVGDWETNNSGVWWSGKVPNNAGKKIRLEFSVTDQQLIEKLGSKLGVQWQPLLRMGLRKLAEAEGLR